MKRLQTKFHVDTMSHSKVIKSTKSQNLSLGQNFLADQFFSRYRYFIKVKTKDFAFLQA